MRVRVRVRVRVGVRLGSVYKYRVSGRVSIESTLKFLLLYFFSVE